MKFKKAPGLKTLIAMALALFFGVSANAQEAPADSVDTGDDLVSIYGGIAGGVTWANDEADDTYTGSVLVFTQVAKGGSIVLEYESDANAVLSDIGEDATLTKLGFAYQRERYGVCVSFVRDGQAQESPETGPEVSGILAIGSEGDRWSSFMRITYVNTDASAARVGIYGRL